MSSVLNYLISSLRVFMAITALLVDALLQYILKYELGNPLPTTVLHGISLQRKSARNAFSII